METSYLSLTKRIMQDELTNEELIDCLNIPNVPVIQHTILKIIKKQLRDPKVHMKLMEYSQCMEAQFKILGPCKIGHLAIYALKNLDYADDFQKLYKQLSNDEKEFVVMLEKSFLSDPL